MWGQLSDAIQTWVEALDNFDIIQEASAGMELLTAIQGLGFIVQRTKSTKYSLSTWSNANYLFKKDKNVTVADTTNNSTMSLKY